MVLGGGVRDECEKGRRSEAVLGGTPSYCRSGAQVTG